jgi:predicted PurR-regulated permease PerM
VSASPPPSQPTAGAAVGAAPAVGAPGNNPSAGGPLRGAATETLRFDSWGQRLTLARGPLFAFFFFAAFIFLLYQLYRVFAPFLGPIVWAAILTLVFYPLYQRVLRRLRGNDTLAALALTLLVTMAIVVPTVSLSSVVTRESIAFYQQVTEFVNSGRLKQTLEALQQSRPGRLVQRLSRQGWEVDYGAVIKRVADTVSSEATAFARNVAVFLLNFAIMLFTLFFLFRDGERMFRRFRDLVPMDPEHKDAVFSRLYETLAAVMRGMVVTALTQGVLCWVGLAVLGFSYSAFLGVLAGFFSLFPIVGAAGVWVPCTLYLAFAGDLVRAAALLAYGTLIISMVDNVLRPLLIGGRARLPTVFLFFGMLGGLEIYGVLGLFLGPVLLSIVVAFVKIYQEQYTGPEQRTVPPLG